MPPGTFRSAIFQTGAIRTNGARRRLARHEERGGASRQTLRGLRWLDDSCVIGNPCCNAAINSLRAPRCDRSI